MLQLHSVNVFKMTGCLVFLPMCFHKLIIVGHQFKIHNDYNTFPAYIVVGIMDLESRPENFLSC